MLSIRVEGNQIIVDPYFGVFRTAEPKCRFSETERVLYGRKNDLGRTCNSRGEKYEKLLYTVRMHEVGNCVILSSAGSTSSE